MKISFANKKIEKSLSSKTQMNRHYGVLTKRIEKIIFSILRADNLKELYKVKYFRLHELSGRRKGQYAIKISGNWRLIFTVKEKYLNLEEIKEIIIIEIIDYH